jgi:hypothetical protein
MLRIVTINPEGMEPAYVKDYPQFDKFSRVNVQFAMMEFTNGDYAFVNEIMSEDGGLVLNMDTKVAYMNEETLVVRIYMVN